MESQRDIYSWFRYIFKDLDICLMQLVISYSILDMHNLIRDIS